MNCRRPWLLAWLIATPVLLAGCATHIDRLREVRNEFYGGNLDAATEKIEKYGKSYRGEADVFQLDRAIVELAAGRPKQAEQILRTVRDRLDYLDQTSLAEQSVSMLTDDTATSYAGEDYEKILVRSLLALANLMGDGSDAAAYGLQATDIQERIIQAGADKKGDNPKLTYKRVALGSYIQGIMREETQANYDDAARCWARVVSWEPSFPYGRYDLDRATHGHHSQRGNGVLYVFALVGQGPYKDEKIEPISSITMLVGDRIFSALGKHTLPPTTPILVPVVIVPTNPTTGIRVSVNRQVVGETATITDVGQLAKQQYDAIYPRVLLKAVARRVAKDAIVYAAKDATKVSDGSWVNLLVDLGGMAWQATEVADTRCWGLLPGRIQVMRVELPAGEHYVGLLPDGSYGPTGEQGVKVKVADGRNTYVLANFADGRLIGKISTNEN
jgi:hypothetical protein